jgi:cytoskeletal protein CcmA (bactofilin family)
MKERSRSLMSVLKREKDRNSTDFGEVKAFLGEGTEFKGVLSFEGTVRIDGALEGEILGEDLLIVGEPAVVKAEIDVGTAVVSGTVHGNIRARQRVELLAPSIVTGTICTPALVVAAGASFNGTCEMSPREDPKVVRLEKKKEGEPPAAESA